MIVQIEAKRNDHFTAADQRQQHRRPSVASPVLSLCAYQSNSKGRKTMSEAVSLCLPGASEDCLGPLSPRNLNPYFHVAKRNGFSGARGLCGGTRGARPEMKKACDFASP
jgi:hypothetical protein